VDTSNPVMVGDRLHDVLGAAEHGVPTILVDWGYGEPVEHARAFVTVGSADALTETLLGR
jgi:phosphoglycolate phosphatase